MRNKKLLPEQTSYFPEISKYVPDINHMGINHIPSVTVPKAARVGTTLTAWSSGQALGGRCSGTSPCSNLNLVSTDGHERRLQLPLARPGAVQQADHATDNCSPRSLTAAGSSTMVPQKWTSDVHVCRLHGRLQCEVSGPWAASAGDTTQMRSRPAFLPGCLVLGILPGALVRDAILV